jgi:endonuclease IV
LGVHTGIAGGLYRSINEAKEKGCQTWQIFSKVDRHWHIGAGEIGAEGLSFVINHPKLRKVPFILETPQDDQRDDVKNLAAARALVQL